MKRISIPIVILLLCLILISCSEKKTELRLGVFSGSVWNVPYWQSYEFFDFAIARYEEMNPHVNITYRSGTLKEDYSEWLSQEVLKGSEPDLFLLLPEDFNLFARLGILEKLDSRMDDGFDASLFYSNAIESGLYEQKQYGIPLEIVPILMFVNKTILMDNAIVLPDDDWTWSDFIEISRQLSSNKSISAVQGFDWKLAAYTNGQQLFSHMGDQAFLTKEGVVDAVKFIGELNALNASDDSFDFEDGNVAFSPLLFSEYRAFAYYPYSIQKYKNFDWEARLLPRGLEGLNGADLKSLLMGVSSRSREKDLAWDFLYYLITDEEVQKSIFTFSHGIPVLKQILELDESRIFLNRGKDADAPLLSPDQITSSIENSLVFPRFAKYEESLKMIDNELQQVEQHPSRLIHQLSVLNNEVNEFLKH
jgi:multiple sugar transport system substrate-binding protein